MMVNNNTTLAHSCADDAAFWDEMVEYVKPEYSRKKIELAGKMLARTLTTPDDDVVQTFRIAHNWRSAHVLPMHRVRQELIAKVRSVQPGATTAARLKRMSSIRRKLATKPLTLYQLQDIGGCRVILRSIAAVTKLVEIYRNGGSRHGLRREFPYIEEPKKDGYRCHHLIFKFNGQGEEGIYNRQSIELQIRTRLQHAWATAVEAVGLVRGENLKAQEGSPEWLRFFELMAGEFAVEEGCPLVPGVPDDEGQRRIELRDLERSLSAIKNLENYNQIIKFTEDRITHSRYYLIQYNSEDQRVTVEPFYNYDSGSRAYIDEESVHGSRNTVLVEVDKVEDLKEAFPNYFLDVEMFTERLKRIIFGLPAATRHDLSWLSDFMGRKPR